MKPKLKQAMDNACCVLHAEGIQFDHVDDYQLKVGSWSFYPTRGTIFQDEADQKDPRSGLAAFIEILKQHNLCPKARPRLVATPPASSPATLAPRVIDPYAKPAAPRRDRPLTSEPFIHDTPREIKLK
jgi:hypothetical protein